MRRYHDKEAFVTGHEGSTAPFEIFLLCLVVPASLYLHRTIVIAINNPAGSPTRDCRPHEHHDQQHQRRDVAVEFITLILPMLLVQTSLLTFIIGPCLLLLGMVAVAGAVRQRTTHRIRSIEEDDDATNNNFDNNMTVSRVKVQEEQEDIRTLPRDIFGRITPVKKKRTAVDATPRKQKSRTKTTKMTTTTTTTTTTTVVMDTTITTPTRDVFGRIKYNINNELSSSKEDVTRTNNNKQEETAAAIAQLTHNNHNHTNITHHTNRPIYLSAHRAYVYLLTMIAILAVDFPLFPRRYCKTDIYGYDGFMDLGAASFVIVAGWTSVMQHHQYQKSINTSSTIVEELQIITITNYYKVIKKCIPLKLIGIISLAITKGLEYQDHVSEYGVHWNFFFTLCCVELIMIV